MLATRKSVLPLLRPTKILDEIRKLSHGRIYSRLVEMCYMIPMQGIDYRQHMQTVRLGENVDRTNRWTRGRSTQIYFYRIGLYKYFTWGCFAVDGTDKGALHRQLRGSGATAAVGAGTGWLTAEYAMLPGSSPRRVSREGATGKVNSRSREIQRLIGRSLRAAVDLEKLGERTLYVDCDVIQADGGTRTASITGAYVALRLAVDRLIAEGDLKGTPLTRPVAAVSVGVIEDQVMLDLCYEEDVRAETDMNVVMTNEGGIIEMQGTAEGKPFDRKQTDTMLDYSAAGIREIMRIQEAVLSA